MKSARKIIHASSFIRLLQNPNPDILLDVRSHQEIIQQDLPLKYLSNIEKIDIDHITLLSLNSNELSEILSKEKIIYCLCKAGVRSSLA